MRKYFNFNNNITLHLELYRAKDEFSIGLELENEYEHTISLKLCLPFLFKFYLSLDLPLSKTTWWQKLLLLDEEHKYQGRLFEFSFSPDNDAVGGKDYWISLQLGSYPWSSGGGWSFFKSLTTLIYGDSNYNRTVVNAWNIRVFIPGVNGYSGGTYDLVIKEELANWKWKRFNKTFSGTYYEVFCEKGVPNGFKYGYPNSLYSLSCPAKNKEDAIFKFITAIQESRQKY